MKNHVLAFLALLTFKNALAEQHCAPCRQVVCNPLPSNCIYGVTLDHCGCCNVCIEGNGERCTFVPSTNGMGFECVWGSSSDTSERINEILASQLRHSLGLSPFFRAFFKIPEAFENHFRALNSAKMLQEHTIIQNIFHGPQHQATTQNNEEYYKKYPTCGLFDYLTTEATDDRTDNSGNLNIKSQLSNAHLIASTAGQDSKPLVSEVQEITKTKVDRKSKDVLQRTGVKKEEEDHERFEAKSPLIKKLKQSSSQHEDKPKRGDQGLSTYAKQSQNINNNWLDNSNEKHLDELHHDKYNVKKEEEAIAGSTENKVIAMLEIGKESETGGKQKKEISKLGMKSNSMKGIYKDVAQITSKGDPASQLLGGTISDFISLFLKRAMAMHFAHEDAHGNLEIMESKVDPVANLKYMIERKHQVSQQQQPDHKATDMDDEESLLKDSKRKLQNEGQFTDSIDNHQKLFVRKIAHDKVDAGVEENKMNTVGKDSDNIKLFHKSNNQHSSEYENRQGIQIENPEDNEKEENELLKGDWGISPKLSKAFQELNNLHSSKYENRQGIRIENPEDNDKEENELLKGKNKEFHEFNNLRSSEYENRQGIPIENHEDNDKGENEQLEGDWDNNKEETIKAASFVNKSSSDSSLQLKFQPRKRINTNVLKPPAQKRQGHDGDDVSEKASERKRNNIRSEKKDTFKPGQNGESSLAKPFRYGSFIVSRDGQFRIKTSDVRMQMMRELMNDIYPGRLLSPDEEDIMNDDKLITSQ